jgi:hypothetical protein
MENKTKITLSEKLIQRQYNPDFIPPKDQVVFTISELPIGVIQNFIILSGVAKAGKSTFLAAAISSAFMPGDVFGMKFRFPEGRRKIAYFDTEQSEYDFFRQVNKVKNFAHINGLPEWAHFYSVREDSPSEIKALIETYLENNPECPVVIIDGILDLCLDYNSEVESRQLINWFKKLTKVYNCLFIGVLHQGKGLGNQTLGHLGSNCDRWASSTLEVIKDKDKKTFTLQPRFLRSSEDFEPVVLMNYDNQWRQVDNVKMPENDANKSNPTDLSEMTHKKMILQVLAIHKPYKDLIADIQELTAKGTSYAKKICKIWIEKNLIVKNTKNLYEKRF